MVSSTTALPPLSLYVHLPWCVRKCPYCDFNSHALNGALDEDNYIAALLRDLEQEAARIGARRIETIFFGGGTPSLFTPAAIGKLLDGIHARIAVAAGAEITLEANPGTVDTDRFRGFRAAGVNRLSIGVQSFEDQKLHALGRIHGSGEAHTAAVAARSAGFENFNLDLMYGLPGQTVAQAEADVRHAIELAPTHLSVYQLTLEPNTLFHARPPVLPDEQLIEGMQDAVFEQLTSAGYRQYEVSAYAQSGKQCRHNLNYWEFGDYVGIGAGAHGKITGHDGIVRTTKSRHPATYLRDAGTTPGTQERLLAQDDIAFEFLLNALRLHDGFAKKLFSERTGLAFETIAKPLQTALEKGLLEVGEHSVCPTAVGRRFLNDLLILFLPAKKPGLDQGN